MIDQLAVPRRTLLGAAAAAPAVVLLPSAVGCSRAEPAQSGRLTTEVTYLTSFSTFGRDAYAYVAQAKGFFAARDLDVTIQPGNGANRNVTDLLGGSAQFAVLDLSGATIIRGQGTDGFAALAGIHQQAPAALMATDPAIRGPLDLAGRTVGMAPGAVIEQLWPAYATTAGLDPDEVDIVPLDPQQLLQTLAAGRVDAVEQFVMGRPTAEAATGRPVTVLPYADYLGDLYGVALHTTTGLAESNPDLCARFRDGLLAGLAYALEYPEEAGEILEEAVPEQDPQVTAAELELMRPYTVPLTPGDPLGAIDLTRVEKSIALLEAVGAIPIGHSLDPDDLVAVDLLPGGHTPTG